MSIVLVSLLLGLVAAATSGMPATTPEVLNAWVLRVALPAVVLHRIPAMAFDPALAAPALAPWGVFLGAAVLFAGLGRAMGWSRALVGCLVLTAGLGNTSFAGLPMVEAVVGPAGVGPALVADQLGSFLCLSTLGLWVAAVASGNELSGRAVALRIVRFPPFIALVAALLVRALGGWPEAALPTLSVLGGTLTPVALFSVGLQLRWQHIADRPGLWVVGLGWKLMLAPALAALLLGGRTDLPSTVAVLQAGMAPMVTGGILAQERGLEPGLAATMVGVGLMASLITVPAWGWWLG